MGWWKSGNGIIGDGAADIMDEAFDKIEKQYRAECGRPPTQGELANLIEFCTAGCLKPTCGDPDFAFENEILHEDDVPRVAERGEQGVLGSASTKSRNESGAQMANINPKTGKHY